MGVIMAVNILLADDHRMVREGLKQLLAYELYVTYGLYQKEIAKLLGCSNNTVANHVKKINKYNHLKDFKSERESKKNQVEQAFKTIKNEI